MTFQEFQATRRPADARAMQAAGATPNDETKHGLLYAGTLFIESTEEWGDCEKQGRWYLCIERSEYISDDLESLERVLYAWGIDAGNIEEQCALCRCIVPPGEGLRIGDDLFCSEACHQEAEEK